MSFTGTLPAMSLSGQSSTELRSPLSAISGNVQAAARMTPSSAQPASAAPAALVSKSFELNFSSEAADELAPPADLIAQHPGFASHSELEQAYKVRLNGIIFVRDIY